MQAVLHMALKYPKKGRSSLKVVMSSPGCTRQLSYDCSLAHERVKGGLSTHFLKSRCDVCVPEGDRIIRLSVYGPKLNDQRGVRDG